MGKSEQEFDLMLQAVADPTRRRILRALKEQGACSIGKDEGLCASDIEERVRLSQPTISHHMSVLTKSGLVDVQKLGVCMCYRRSETSIGEFSRRLNESLKPQFDFTPPFRS